MGLTLFGKVRSGQREWIFQRVSNLSIGLWGALFIVQLFLMNEANYAEFQAIFAPLWFKAYTSLTLLLIGVNSMLAGWQIGTDYVKKESVNRIFTFFCILISIDYVIAGLYILWLL